MADPASTASTFSALPAQLQTALTWGLGAGGLLAGVLAYFKPPKPKPADPGASTLAVAMAAPMGDPNQLRQAIEELHKLNDYAFQLTGLADDIKDGIRDLKDGQRELRDAIGRQTPR